MIQLFINDMEVTLTSGTSFTLTDENPYFTGASQYSDEVEIEIGTGNNAKIFGNVTRKDVTKQASTYNFRLVNNNSIFAAGVATITKVSDTMVTVQLLGDNSAVNFKAKFEDQYIDLLDLGDCWDYFRDAELSTTYKDHVGNTKTIRITDQNTFMQYLQVESYNTHSSIGEQTSNTSYANLLLGLDGDWGCTFLPAMSDDGTVYNRVTTLFYGGIEDREYLPDIWPCFGAFLPTHTGTWYDPFLGQGEPSETKYFDIAIQPFYYNIIKRVFSALGYEIQYTVTTLFDDWRKFVYLPNITQSIYFKDMLPHWTVTKFLDEVERFFGIVFLFDESTKTVKFIDKNTYFSTLDKAYLSNVIDSYEVEFDEDNSVDMSGSNVSFDVENDNFHCFPSEVNEQAIRETYEDITQLRSSMSSEVTTFGHDPKAVIADCGTGTDFIIYDSEIVRANQLRDHKIDDGSDTIDLGIRPPKMGGYKLWKLTVKPTGTNNKSYIDSSDYASNYLESGPEKWPAPTSVVYGVYHTEFSVQDGIEDALQKNSKPDYMLAAVLNRFTHNVNLNMVETTGAVAYFPVKFNSVITPITHGDDDVSDLGHNALTSTSYYGEAGVLRLNPYNGASTLYDSSVNVGVSIKGQKKVSFTFYDDRILKLDRYFIIGGKRYACEKIEYHVSPDGISRERTGYFYPVE